MKLPQITYTDDTGPATLDFVFPPVTNPAFSNKADRKDVFSTAGVRQTTILAKYTQHPIKMPIIFDDGADLPAWQRFVDWALQGGSFVYNPDSDNPLGGVQCFMVEDTGVLDFSTPGIYSFTGTFQEEIPG